MTLEEVIDQLEGLKEYCKGFTSGEKPDSTFNNDIEALSIAINIIKKEPVAPQQNRHSTK